MYTPRGPCSPIIIISLAVVVLEGGWLLLETLRAYISSSTAELVSGTACKTKAF
jgi:hypothetical protein